MVGYVAARGAALMYEAIHGLSFLTTVCVCAQVALHVKIMDDNVSSVVFDPHNRNPCMYSLDRKQCQIVLCKPVSAYEC